MKSSSRLFTIGLVASWYSSNIGVLLLNKYLLSNYGFKYPIFLTMCHMTACSLLSYIAITWMKMVPLQAIRSRVQFMKISALSLVFCGSVVSGNISLRYLPVSFNQAIGATTPFFTAVFAYLITLKREAWLVYGALIPVVTGVVIASGSEPSFHLFGVIMCVGATAARALKSVLQGILLSSEGEKLNSMNLLLYMAPVAVVLLLPATLYMEENVVGITLALAKDDINIVWLLLFNSALAYFVNLTNFLVTKHTSALTLQVLGNAKGAVAVIVSILIFKNPVSVTGMLGYTLAVIGVIFYSQAKNAANENCGFHLFCVYYARIGGNHLEATFGSCAWIQFLLPSNFYFFIRNPHSWFPSVLNYNYITYRVDSLINAHLSSLFFPAWGY